MDPTERISTLITPSLEAMGYDVVRVLLQGKQRPTLQIMAERVDRGAMTVDDCAEISRAVSALLDVEDPLPGAYQLEVSSPGIDRPLVRPEDFDRFAGFEARLETTLPLEGRKRFKGRLLGRDGNAIRLRVTEGAEVAVPLDLLKKAKLVLTDDLLAAARAEQGSV